MQPAAQPSHPVNVAIVMGGAGPDHQVSLAGGKSIATAVELLGHTAVPLVIDPEGNWRDGQHEAIELMQACDVTIPVMHSGGTLQGFLAQLKILYVGSGVPARVVGLDKHLIKAFLKAHGIAVTPLEPELVGRQIELAVLEFPDGRVETAPAEIHADPEQAPGLAERLRRTAIDVFEVLGCAGLARVDVVVRANGEPMVDGIDTFPEFTPVSWFPRRWAAAGMPYAEVVDTLIRTALERR